MYLLTQNDFLLGAATGFFIGLFLFCSWFAFGASRPAKPLDAEEKPASPRRIEEKPGEYYKRRCEELRDEVETLKRENAAYKGHQTRRVKARQKFKELSLTFN